MSISEIGLILSEWLYSHGTKVCFLTFDFGAQSHEGKEVSQEQQGNKYEDIQDNCNFANV